MSKSAPHYLLLTESDYDPANTSIGGRWRFVLEPMNGDLDRIEVSEREADIWGERLQLLAVVRGVEALHQRSKLTLITSSSMVSNRIRKGFDTWIEKDWRWERFGMLKPIKDADLWQRVHAATMIHEIECRAWQFANRRHDFSAIEDYEFSRIDQAHRTPRKPYGPPEFEQGEPAQRNSEEFVGAFDSHDQPRFVSTRTGWTRVTEVDPDNEQPVIFPQAFVSTPW